MRRILTTGFICSIILLSCSEHNSKNENSGASFFINEYTSIPLVKYKVNGKDAYFIMDTGAGLSVVDEKESKKYDIQDDGNGNVGRITGIGGSTYLSRANQFSIELNDKPLNGSFFIGDLSNVVDNIRSKTGISILGIIGSDLMQLNKMIIDYSKDSIFIKY